MKRSSLWVAVAVVVACASAPAAPLAERLPGEALAYLGWAGRTDAFNASDFGKMLEDPVIREIFGAIEDGILRNIEEEEGQQIFKDAWALAGIVWQRPMAAALLDLQAGDGEPRPSAALIIDLGDKKLAFARHLSSLIFLTPAGQELRDTQAAGVPYKVMPGPEGMEIAYGYVGNTFFVCIGDAELPAKLITQEKAGSLAEDDRFSAAVGEVGGDGAQIVIYYDIETALEKAEPMLAGLGGPAMLPPMPHPTTRGTIEEAPRPTGRPMRLDEDGPPDFRQILRAMGLGKMTTLAASAKFVEGGVYSKLKLATPAPHEGLLLLAGGKALQDADLAEVPADADWVMAGTASPKELFDAAMKAVGDIEPRERDDFEQRLAQIEDQMGVSLRKDILGSLGETCVVSGAASQGGFLTGMLVTMRVEDGERLDKALSQIGAFFEKQLTPPPEPPEPPVFWTCPLHMDIRSPEPGVCPVCGMELMSSEQLGMHMQRRPRHSFALRSMPAGGTKVRYVAASFEEFPMPVAPAWAVRDGKLYFALWPQVIVAAFDQIEARTAGSEDAPRRLIDTPAYRALRKRLPDKATVLYYENTPKILRTLYPLGLAGWTAGANALKHHAKVDASIAWLPPVTRVEKYVGPYMFTVTAEEDGIVIEDFGSMPFQSMGFAQGMNPLLVATLMPALNRARGLAKRSVSAANLNAIGKGCALYQAEFNDQLPPALGTLIEHGYIGTGALVHPASGNPPPKLVEGKLVGEIDYVYLGAGKSVVDEAATTILAHDKPEHNGFQGVNVVFLDGHVEWMTMDQFQQQMHLMTGRMPHLGGAPGEPPQEDADGTEADEPDEMGDE